MRIAINGFGRIGRLVFRNLLAHPDMEVVQINDLTDPKTLAHLLKWDSVHGKFEGTLASDKDSITVNGKRIAISAERDPAKLPHKQNQIDFCIEATGIFASREACQKHIDAGAGKVILTVPAKDEIDAMIVMGVNHETLKPEDRIISNASCTTNCLAPLVKVLDDAFGIEHGLMTTIHAYTNDQVILDFPHKDLRRARAAACSIIPTTTGAAKAVGKILPHLKGKLDGVAMRVPVPDGSMTDFVCVVKKPVTVESVNAAFEAASRSKGLKGLLVYETDPIVSCDIIGNPASSIFDVQSTMVLQGTMVKVVAWYDNEWGYSARVVDLVRYAHSISGAKKPAGATR